MPDQENNVPQINQPLPDPKLAQADVRQREKPMERVDKPVDMELERLKQQIEVLTRRVDELTQNKPETKPNQEQNVNVAAVPVDLSKINEQIDSLKKDSADIAFLKSSAQVMAAEIGTMDQELSDLKTKTETINAQVGDMEYELDSATKATKQLKAGNGIVIQHQGDVPMISSLYEIRWEFAKVGDTTMNVGPGTITRNDIPLTSTATDVAGFSSPGTRYLTATLATATGKNPRLIPASVVIGRSDTYPATDPNGKLVYVLGSVVVDDTGKISNFTQFITDNICDPQEIPDARRHVNTDPLLKTINRNPNDNVHEGELEMFRADSIALAGTQDWKSRKGLPFLDKDANYSGYLDWAGIDSDGTQKSIEIEATSKLAQIYKMDKDAEAAQTGMDLCVRTDAAGQVFWVDADTFVSKVDVTVITGIGWNAATGFITITTKVLTVFAAAAPVGPTDTIQFFPCATETVSGQMSVNGVTTDVTILGAANP